MESEAAALSVESQTPSGSCLLCGYDKPWVVWNVDKNGNPTTGACEDCKRGADREKEAHLRAFHAICDVWDTAVATGLPDEEKLRVELVRLQEHTGLLSIADIEARRG